MLIDSVKLKKCIVKFIPILPNDPTDKGYELGLKTSIKIIELFEKHKEK